MQILKKAVIEVWFGIMVGTTVYLAALMFHAITIHPTTQNIASIFLMSGLIGLLSFLFQIDRLPFVLILGIHCLGTFFIVVVFNYLFHWDFLSNYNLFPFLLDFIIIYLIIWIGLYIYWWLTAKKINMKLKERRKKN